MTADKRSVHTDALETLGTIISANEARDAIHLAVEPVVAAQNLMPGQDVGFVAGGVGPCDAPVGIVDPFLKSPVLKGERFWLVVYPRQITSLRHVWTHPAFAAGDAAAGLMTNEVSAKSASEKWMRAWAMEHMNTEWEPQSEDAAYRMAIEAGHEHCVGSYEDARDYIDGEWWAHWEAITGEKGNRGEYFSCSC